MTLPLIDQEHILEHTRPLWKDLQGGRLFITGGTGFFGTWLLESFVHANRQLNLNAQAVVLTRLPQRPALPEVTFHIGDVRDFTFPAGAFSHVIHAATAASQKMIDEEPRLMAETILDGTRRTLAFAKHCGAKRFLFASSGAVYGPQPTDLELIPETYLGAPDPLLPRSAYGAAKRMAEHLCLLHSREDQFEAVMARAFAFVGPHLPLDAHYAIGNFIRDGLSGKPIRVESDGSAVRSYLYAADLAIWLWTLLFRGTGGQAYNVGASPCVSIGELAQQVGTLCNVPVSIAQKPVPGSRPARYAPDTQRAEQAFGLKAWVSLPAALERTIDWHRRRN